MDEMDGLVVNERMLVLYVTVRRIGRNRKLDKGWIKGFIDLQASSSPLKQYTVVVCSKQARCLRPQRVNGHSSMPCFCFRQRRIE